jgi:hypothetical protein
MGTGGGTIPPGNFVRYLGEGYKGEELYLPATLLNISVGATGGGIIPPGNFVKASR